MSKRASQIQAIDHFSASGSSPAGHVGDAEKLIQQAEKLSQLNSWFEVALNNMARGLSMFDADRRLVVCNALYREIYELPDHLTQPGTPFSDLVAYYVSRDRGRSGDTLPDQAAWIENHVAELKRGKIFTHTQHLKNGRIILVSNQPLADGGWVDIQEDVTEKTAAAERITWLAKHCPLTEIANRLHLCEQLEAAVKVSEGKGLVAVHLIDLDRFKAVNDTHGHAAGDALLKAVARRMKATVRAEDVVGRLGGDEFAIVQTNIVSMEQVHVMAERLVKVLNAPYRVLGHSANVGASIGVAIAPVDGNDPETLLRRADIALYSVKSAGRGAFAIYRDSDEAAARTQMQLENDLWHALERNELEMHYQPIVDMQSGTVTTCEALMRWRHPQHGLILPGTFIPLAEKSELILELGQWAMRRACLDALSWPSNCGVTVNVSPLQLDRDQIVDSVRLALESTMIDPKRLELEITEGILLKSDLRIRDRLESIRSLGVRIALDDFGISFASLSYLRDFNFDKVKIDRSFVREIGERRDCDAIVHAVAGLAHALQISSVAEGVETAEQLERVLSAGCSAVQGYYFSKPVPLAELDDVLAQCAAKMPTPTSTAA